MRQGRQREQTHQTEENTNPGKIRGKDGAEHKTEKTETEKRRTQDGAGTETEKRQRRKTDGHKTEQNGDGERTETEKNTGAGKD